MVENPDQGMGWQFCLYPYYTPVKASSLCCMVIHSVYIYIYHIYIYISYIYHIYISYIYMTVCQLVQNFCQLCLANGHIIIYIYLRLEYENPCIEYGWIWKVIRYRMIRITNDNKAWSRTSFVGNWTHLSMENPWGNPFGKMIETRRVSGVRWLI